MKRYIKAKVNLSVGSNLVSDYEHAWEIVDFLCNYSKYYLVCFYNHPLGNTRYILLPGTQDYISSFFEGTDIANEIELVDHQTYLELIGDSYLYPLSDDMAKKISSAEQTTYDNLDTIVSNLIKEESMRTGIDDEHTILQSWG
jgi:hypothetical protein